MKRVAMFALVGLVAGAALAAGKEYAFNVQRALLTALQNEREAAARYDACATKADQDGYPGAAALFRAAAKAERVHEHRFEVALKRGGVDIPANTATTPDVGSTTDNLRNSAVAEQRERDGTYRDAIDAAKGARDSEIAKLFDVTRDAETEHGNLCTNALHEMNKMKEPRTYYVCMKCGYVSDIALPLCPSCREPHGLEDVQ